MSDSKQVVYIECGTTMFSGVNTGIQRVVRNIIANATEVGESLGLECIPVRFADKGFHPVDPEAVLAAAGATGNGGVLQGLKEVLKRSHLFMQLYRLLMRTKRIVKGMFSSQDGDTLLLESEGQQPILLLLDSSWYPQIWPAVERFRQRGGYVCAVLYDLIPFTHPETVAGETREAHTAWWSHAPEHVDGVICISQAVRNEFLAQQPSMPVNHALSDEQVGYFYLGSELSSDDPQIRLLSEEQPFFMVVGSLEPRKNHTLILDAFDRLWGQGSELRLCIVGAYGWKSDALIERIMQHPQLNRHLFLIRDASDRDLTALYAETRGLIIASYAEGFGLPIVEAYQRGAPVLCSDIPVFREIAGDDAIFFDPFDADSLSSAVLESALAVSERPARRRTREWISWSESARQLFSRVKQMAELAR